MTFSYEIRGANRVGNALRKLASLNKNVIDPIGRKWAQGVRGKLKAKPYPAKRPLQTYVRTGNLANKWAVENQGLGKWAIVNRTDYGGFVVGEKQAFMHLGRWWIARDVIQEEIPNLTKDLSQEIERIWST